MMPGLDGWRVAEELLDDPRTESIPIVFLTARAELRDRARGIDLGGVDYVTKPFNPVELAPLVRDLLERVARGERDDLRREKLTELRARGPRRPVAPRRRPAASAPRTRRARTRRWRASRAYGSAQRAPDACRRGARRGRAGAGPGSARGARSAPRSTAGRAVSPRLLRV